MIQLEVKEHGSITKVMQAWATFIQHETKRKSTYYQPETTSEGEILVVPEGLDVTETALWIRQQMIDRGIDPDTSYLVATDLGDVTDDVLPVTVTMSVNYGAFDENGSQSTTS